LSDPTEQTPGQGVDLPPTLRAERDQPPLPQRPWYLGIGPAYLTIFVWAPFFDPLWMDDWSWAQLPWRVGIAVLAPIICFALFFYPMATWGHRTRRGLGVVAASTFGTAGSEWITGVGIGVAEVVWYAVAIGYAVESTLLGLATSEIISSDVLGPWEVGPLILRTPVFLLTAAFWIFITGTASLLRLTAVIAALMKVYAPVALLLLTAAALWIVVGPGADLVTEAHDVSAMTVVHEGGYRSLALPLYTGFFAMLGLSSVDWGAASARGRDVTIGGLTGIVLAGSWTATMSLLVVAGTMSRRSIRSEKWPWSDVGAPDFSFRWGIVHGIGGYPAATILILFGLAALAPACYSAWGYSNRLATHWSLSGRRRLTWIGGAIALAMIAVSWSSRLQWVDYFMGVVFAPVAGALVGDLLNQRGGWAGVRRGVNPPGVIAWLAGMVSAVPAELAARRSSWLGAEFLGSPVIGFLTAVLVYWLMARIGLERPSIPLAAIEVPASHDGAESGDASEGSDLPIGRNRSEPRPSESGPEG
jgi:cytosine permease